MDQSPGPVGERASREEGWAWLERYWWVPLLTGTILAVFGIVILANVVTTSKVLAVLLGLFLIFDGVSSLTTARRAGKRWPAFILGSILVVGGIVAIAWPSATLRVLALIFGATLIAGGVLRLIAWGLDRDRRTDWGFWLASASLVVGVLAVAWPQATVYVIIVLIGIRAIVSGVTQIGMAFDWHHHTPLHRAH